MKLIIFGGVLIVSVLLAVTPAKAEISTTLKPCQHSDFDCSNTRKLRLSQLHASRLSNQFLSLIQTGRDYREGGNYPQAIETFQTALQLAQQSGYLDGEWLARSDIAMTHQRAGNWQKALELYQQNFLFFQQHQQQLDDVTKGPYTLIYISDIHTAQKNYPKAIEVLRQGLALTDTITSSVYSDTKARILQHLGVNLFLAGNLKEADANLLKASTLYENLRQQRVGEQTPMVVDYSNEIEINRWRQQVLVAQNRTHEALELAEQNRARAFVALLATRLKSNPDIQLTTSPNLEQIKQIAKAENATLVQYTVTYEYNPNSAFWSSNYEEFRANNLFIWVIKPTGEIAFRRSNFTGQKISLGELVEQAREFMGVRGRGLGVVGRGEANRPTAKKQPVTQLHRLYQLLIQPIADLLPADPKARVIFIPQDALFLVPFPALKDSAGKYLIEKHTLLTSPSIQVLGIARAQQQRIQDTAKGVLIVGNPTMPSLSPSPDLPAEPLPSLPGAEQEAMAVAQLFSTQPLIGTQATKSAVLQRLSKARIVHLATHGLLDDVGGFFSSLALAPTAQDRGFLTAREIISLKLNAELVVLSACNTGRGAINGDGVIGLSRSFMAAGVPSVLVSLWSVPDVPTASLLTAFYQNLKGGLDKAQALRQAMLKTMKAFPQPVNWAAFTLIGDGNSSGTLRSAGGEIPGSDSSTPTNTQATGSYYTVFPVPENAMDYNETPSSRVPGEMDIYFHTRLSLEELLNFYRQAFSQKGLTEQTNYTRLSKDTMQLVFVGSPNRKQIIIQATEDYLNRNFRGVSVRFE